MKNLAANLLFRCEMIVALEPLEIMMLSDGEVIASVILHLPNWKVHYQ